MYEKSTIIIIIYMVVTYIMISTKLHLKIHTQLFNDLAWQFPLLHLDWAEERRKSGSERSNYQTMILIKTKFEKWV